MNTPQDHWDKLYTTYTQSVNENYLKSERLVKIDELFYTDNIENIRNGLTLMTTIAPEYLCRYLRLDGDSVVLRDSGNFSAPLLAERVLVESVKGESMWLGLYESGAFDSIHFRSLDDVSVEDLSESEKEFCVRMAKEMVRIPAGDFERKGVKVTLTRAFLLFKYQVTQALWESVMGSNPSEFEGANRPVEEVSWFDVVDFCNKLSELEGLEPAYTIDGENVTCNWNAKGYRLPTEAEWEYAARANQSFKYSGSDNLDEVAWYDGNSGDETHPVGQKKTNGFGLYDMSGNVWEWVWDIYGTYSSTPTMDPRGPDSGSVRVRRGGCCSEGAWYGWVSFRIDINPSWSSSVRGFRLCRLSP